MTIARIDYDCGTETESSVNEDQRNHGLIVLTVGSDRQRTEMPLRDHQLQTTGEHVEFHLSF